MDAWVLIDRSQPLSAKANISLTQAMLDAIDRIAILKGLSRSDIIRQSMTYGLQHLHPEFMQIYEQAAKGTLR